MNKIKTVIENPGWNFVGVVLTIFFEVGASMFNHTLIQYFMIAIALLLAAHAFYRLWKQKQSTERGITDDCVFDGTLGSPRWLINRKTNEKFCYDCRGKDGSKIHLIRKSLSEWFCPMCKRPYNSKVERMKDLFMKNRRLL